MILFLGLVFILCTPFVLPQTVSNVRLIDHVTYFTSVMQETMNEVERREWCNLKLLDMKQDLNEDMYGWLVTGTVEYTNGFIVSVGSMDLVESSVQQLWTSNSTDNTASVTVRATLELHDVALGFDVVANITEGIQHYTGIYTHTLLQYIFAVTKNIQRNEITTSVSLSSSSGGNPRMIYQPSNSVTEVLQRVYAAWLSSDGLAALSSTVFNPILREVVDTRIQFPRVCYNCND